MIQPKHKRKVAHYFHMRKSFRTSVLKYCSIPEEESTGDTIPAPPPTEPHNEIPEVE